MIKYFRKTRIGFRRNRQKTTQILTICQILEGVRAKNLPATILFVDFSKVFESIHRGKMEQILLVYGLPKETIAAIMMLYKNTKVKVCALYADTNYFDVIVGVPQGDKLAPYLFIICLEDVLRTSIDLMKENGFKLAKERRRYHTQTIKDTDCADKICAQAETLLHSLEGVAAGIGLYVNADKIEYIFFNQRCDISTLKCGPLKLVEKFTYLGSFVSSTCD